MISKRIIHLVYIGFTLARLHIVSYIALIISSALWFTLIFVPTLLFSGQPEYSLRLLMPGVFALSIASASMWSSTEFLRWYVHQGLTDVYRENGLSVFHYLLSGVLVDIVVIGLISYFLSAFIAIIYTGLPLLIIIPGKPLFLVLALIVAIPVYLLLGSIIAYLLTVTNISGSWIGLLQMLVILGTIISPKTIPQPVFAFINPATIVAESLRVCYGTNYFSENILLILIPILIVIYTVLGYLFGSLSNKYIARHGLEYRY